VNYGIQEERDEVNYEKRRGRVTISRVVPSIRL
jgi:hypothetical protein